MPIVDPSAVSIATIVALCAVACIAGFVDAIAGGGGVLTVPALLTTGLLPHQVLGTNKAQSVVGTLTALVRFARAGLVDRRRAVPAFLCGLVGALLGTRLVLWLSPTLLRPVAIVLLLVVASWLTLRRAGASAATPTSTMGDPRIRAALIAAGIGAYDGFFGPGTGTFLVVLHARFLGDPLDRASANAKVVNAASNLGALTLFVAHGDVVWRVAAPMAVAQIAGGWLGSHVAIRNGAPLVRRVVLVVVIALVVKLTIDIVRSGF